MLALTLHLRGEFFFLQQKHAMRVMIRTTRLTAVSPPITAPAIAPALAPAAPGGPVVVVVGVVI